MEYVALGFVVFVFFLAVGHVIHKRKPAEDIDDDLGYLSKLEEYEE